MIICYLPPIRGTRNNHWQYTPSRCTNCWSSMDSFILPFFCRQDGWAEVGDVKPQRAGTGATTDSCFYKWYRWKMTVWLVGWLVGWLMFILDSCYFFTLFSFLSGHSGCQNHSQHASVEVEGVWGWDLQQMELLTTRMTVCFLYGNRGGIQNETFINSRSLTASPCKNGGWKTSLSYWEGNIFWGELVNFGVVFLSVFLGEVSKKNNPWVQCIPV